MNSIIRLGTERWGAVNLRLASDDDRTVVTEVEFGVPMLEWVVAGCETGVLDACIGGAGCWISSLP